MGAAAGAVRDQKDREAIKVGEYLEDTRETSHGVRGSRSGMPADIMASMKDGVIEPKSVLQIFVLSAQELPLTRVINQRSRAPPFDLLEALVAMRHPYHDISCFCFDDLILRGMNT